MSFRLTPHRFFSANPVGTDWVCGDLHGEFDLLQTALASSGIDLLVDRLFLLGDVIDRGPQSRALLEWALVTPWVYSVIGNHELLMIAGVDEPSLKARHRAIGGEWVDQLDPATHRSLATRCRQSWPLTITLAHGDDQVGLVHAQSPARNWGDVQASPYTRAFAMDCTWPWDRAQGEHHPVEGVTAVVSGHIGTDRVIRKANQVWIDTLARTGQVPLMPVSQILAWVNGEARHE